MNKLPKKFLIFALVITQLLGIFYLGFFNKEKTIPKAQAGQSFIYYLPLVANDTRSFITDILIQKVDVKPTISYTFFHGDGSTGTNGLVLSGYSTLIAETRGTSLQDCLNQGAGAPQFPVCTILPISFPAGYRGTAVFTSDQEVNISVRTRIFVANAGYINSSYNAIVNQSNIVFVPTAYTNKYGGYCSSFFNVVNVGNNSAPIKMKYKSSNTFTKEVLYDLPAHAQYTLTNNSPSCPAPGGSGYDTENISKTFNIQDQTEGTITVSQQDGVSESPQLIAQMAEAKTDSSKVYGFTPGVPATLNRIQFVPQVSNGGFGGFYTGTDYFNATNADIGITVDYLFSGSLNGTGQPCTFRANVPAQGVYAKFDNDPSDPCLTPAHNYGFAKVTADAPGIGCVSNVGAGGSRFGSNPCSGTDELKQTIGLPIQGTSSVNPFTGFTESSGTSIANINSSFVSFTIKYYEEQTGIDTNIYYKFDSVAPNTFVAIFPPGTPPQWPYPNGPRYNPNGPVFDPSKLYSARIVDASLPLFTVTNVTQSNNGGVTGGWSYVEPNLPYPTYNLAENGNVVIHAVCAITNKGIQNVRAAVNVISSLYSPFPSPLIITTDTSGNGRAPMSLHVGDVENLDVTTIPPEINRIAGGIYKWDNLNGPNEIFQPREFTFTFDCPNPFINVSHNDAYDSGYYKTDKYVVKSPDTAAPRYTAFNTDVVNSFNRDTETLANDFENGLPSKASKNSWLMGGTRNPYVGINNYDELRKFALSTKVTNIRLSSAFVSGSNLDLTNLANSALDKKVFVLDMIDYRSTPINLIGMGGLTDGTIFFLKSSDISIPIKITAERARPSSHILIITNTSVQIDVDASSPIRYLNAGVVSNQDIIVGNDTNTNNQLLIEGFVHASGKFSSKLNYSTANGIKPAVQVNFSPEYYFVFKGDFISRSAGITDRTLVGLD